MSWYETQFKNLQVARSRNKQEARRLQIELERKHGMRAIHEYRLEEMCKEQRLVEKELERIRMGVHRIPLQGESFAALTTRNAQSRRRLAGQEIFVTDSKNVRDNLSPQLNKDNVFLKAIMYVQSKGEPQEPTAEDLIEHSDFTNTLGIAFDSSSVPYPALAISPRVDNAQKSTFVDNSAPNRHIDLPVNERSVEFVPEPSVDFAYAKQNLSKSLLKTAGLVTSSPRSHPRANISPRVKERQAGFSLDLVSLASLDMKSVKADVTRRITQQKSSSQQTTVKRGPATTEIGSVAAVPSEGDLKSKERPDVIDEAAETTPADVMDDVDVQNQEAVKPKEKTEKTEKPRRMKPKEIDPADYNPDGSLKKMYTMPNFEDSWKEAQRARYIRHGKNSDILERERELSVNEVFDKGSKTKGATH